MHGQPVDHRVNSKTECIQEPKNRRLMLTRPHYRHSQPEDHRAYNTTCDLRVARAFNGVKLVRVCGVFGSCVRPVVYIGYKSTHLHRARMIVQ